MRLVSGQLSTLSFWVPKIRPIGTDPAIWGLWVYPSSERAYTYIVLFPTFT